MTHELDPEFREALARARYSIEMKEALKVVNQRLRSLWALRKQLSKEGRFPLPLDEAQEEATRLGYTPDTMSWFKAVGKLSRIRPDFVRRERLAVVLADGGDDDAPEDGLDDFLNSL